MSELLATIVVPQFITKVQMSKKRRAKYYSKKSIKKIPPTFLKKYKFDKAGFLVDDEGKKVIANSRTVGQPRYEVLSGNKLLSGYGDPIIRSKLVAELKNFYRPIVQAYLANNPPIARFPIKVEWEVHTIVEENPNWDASNLFFYYKYFEDCLFEGMDNPHLKSLIPNDTVKYITQPPGAKIVPIANWEDRKFVFKFYYDNRPELRTTPWETKL